MSASNTGLIFRAVRVRMCVNIGDFLSSLLETLEGTSDIKLEGKGEAK